MGWLFHSLGVSLKGNSFLRGMFPPLHALLFLIAKMKALIKEELGGAGYVWFVTWLEAAALVDLYHC